MIDDAYAHSLINQGYETRNVEYKDSMKWDTAKIKVAKAILGMSNIADGGWIIIGVRKLNNHYDPVGITPETENWLDHDKISAYVSRFADPYVEFELAIKEFNKKKFGVIKVNEFPELPIICKKGHVSGDLKDGKMYTRSRRMNETSEVINSHDLREIIDLATRKQVLKHLSIVGSPVSKSEKDKFDEEAEDFK